MRNYEELKSRLEKIYGNKIRVGERNRECIDKKDSKEDIGKIQYTPYKYKYPEEDIIVYINENINYDFTIIWNNIVRKERGKQIKTFSVSKYTWNTLLRLDEIIKCDYITDEKNIYHKVLFIRNDALEFYINDLYYLIEPSNDDDGFPNELLKEENYNSERKRITSTRASRDYKFREKVLRRFGYKCAVCRCHEKKLLQAAHIIPIKDNGDDDPNNGICLCANHHLMYDNGLIKICKNKISYISDSVKKMSWYEEFIKKYKSKLIEGEVWLNDRAYKSKTSYK